MATASLALGVFADLSCITLFVIGAGQALVGEACLSVFALAVGAACSVDALVVFAELACATLGVSEASFAGVFSTDLSVFALGCLQAGHTLFGGGVAFLVRKASFVVTAAFGAGSLFTDLSLAASGVIGAGSASSSIADLSTGARLGFAADGISAGKVLTDLAVGLAVFVASASLATRASIADLSFAAVFVVFTRFASTGFANAAVFACAVVFATFFAAFVVADAILVAAFFVVFAPGATESFVTDLIGAALLVIFA